MNPRITAYTNVCKIMEKGLAKGHKQDAWQDEPLTMHIQKAVRHGMTALLLLEHPDYCKDIETALEHLEQMQCRATFALAIAERKK